MKKQSFIVETVLLEKEKIGRLVSDNACIWRVIMVTNHKEASKGKIEKLFESYLRDYSEHGLLFPDYSEEDTATKFIKPLIEALGWNVLSMQDMREQVAMSEGKHYADCVLYFEKKPYIVLEFKPLDSGSLRNKVEDINRLLRIAMKAKAKYAVLTRFVETIVYNVESRGEIEYFVPVDYKDRFDVLWKYLSKESANQ